MTQQMLFDQTPPRQKKRVNVPRTSVLAYQERPRDARIDYVVNWLTDATYWGPYPTSHELTKFVSERHEDGPCHAGLGALMTIRRGLSDALALGLVEHGAARKCMVSGRTCLTWKIRSR